MLLAPHEMTSLMKTQNTRLGKGWTKILVMSSQFTFTVRFPTGHSVSVRASPNDPVSRIVEEACAKRKGDHDPMGFTVGKQGPAGRFLPVDKSLTIRHANLANRYNVSIHYIPW